MSGRNRVTVTIVFVGLALMLCGCMAVTQLPDGQTSIMSAQGNQERTNLVISPVPTPAALTYRPLKSCTYRSSSVGFGVDQTQSTGEISVRRVRDRLLLVDDSNGKKSTFLMSPSGKIYDFNNINSKGVQTTGDTQAAYQYSIFFPEFTTGLLRPGDTAATIRGKDGKVAGSYQYRGTTTYHGSTGYVLDYVALAPNTPYGAVVAGFSIIDTKSMLTSHLLIAVQDSRLQVDMDSCTQ